jgi:hypothetical protein
MKTTTQTHSHTTQIFSAMIEILISSALGEQKCGLRKSDKRYDQTRYEELAIAMNKEGHRNRAGEPLNRNTLKQIVHRMSKDEDLFKSFKPNWEWFRDTHNIQETTSSDNKTGCLVCGSVVHNKDKKLCSSDCVRVYQEHKDAPHDSKFPTIYHQMRHEESLSQLN